MPEALDITTKNCTIEKEGHTLIVTLNRPEAKNALSPAMLIGMYRAWRRLEEDDDLYCAVLTGQGDTFCAGMDLKTGPKGGEGEDAEEIQRLMQEVPNLHWQALLREDRPNKPIILAVEGFALAGGTEILQGTDLRIAAEDAVLGVTEVIRGLYPLGASAIRLRRQIPYCRAAEILLLGSRISAQRGAGVGPDQPGRSEGKGPRRSAEDGATALRERPALHQGDHPYASRARRERARWPKPSKRQDELGWPVLLSKDAKEGMKAFKEKRKPVYKGR